MDIWDRMRLALESISAACATLSGASMVLVDGVIAPLGTTVTTAASPAHVGAVVYSAFVQATTPAGDFVPVQAKVNVDGSVTFTVGAATVAATTCRAVLKPT